ncbi:MAG: isoleucine--tRNA ligase [Bacilli bacterium]|nr:isoleucine--tRNA ligase [Bacilli bacterium]
MKDYKDTLLMPKTEFKMRGNLAQNESIQRQKWEEMDLYNLIKEKNRDGKPFILHDGPPYANGNIHLGHSLNKILKDFINRSKIMEGYSVEFIPGWDTHGLPIEQAVTNSGVNRKEMSTFEFREYCRKYALKQVDTQREDFKKLNVLADWDNPYITLFPEYEARQIEVFAKMAKKGLIFKGLKPVYWSPSSETALAEAEIEYKDRKDPSIFVSFEVVKGNEKVKQDDKLVIWTTTPWTLPGNTGVCVGEMFDYSRVKAQDDIYIMASDLIDDLMKEFEFEKYEIIDTFKGSELLDVVYKHPFMDRTSPVVLGSHVTLDAGTGLVHTAPGYGVDDFNVGRKYDLPLINGVDDRGYLTEESGMFKGLFFEKANKEITKWLDENGHLLKLKFITHSYPHDWRTKKPIIFRATSQWFCSVDKIKKDILNTIENDIKFHKDWGKTRIYNMIEGRGDWCISRQRAWGVPIPIFYNEDGSEIVDYDVMMHISELFKQHGSNIWFKWDAKDLLPKDYKNKKSPNGEFKKETDIMDVWFDSGTSFAGVLLERGLKYPADVYLEGSDQYRGWFNSSLICSMAAYGKSPYKELVSAGFVLDGKGLKMSKSIGNVVAPMDVVSKQGSDILRLWVSSVDYTEDVKFSNELLSGVQESYRKIRNTYRFMLGNLFDFDPDIDSVKYDKMASADKYMMNSINDLIVNVIKEYDSYNYDEIYKLINNYVNSLSNFYLDFTKDILYIEKSDSLERRSVQTVYYNILLTLIKLMAPILPYTSEEVYKLIPGVKEKSIHLERFPEVIKYKDSEELNEMWELFFNIKNDVYKALETARDEKVIGKSLEAKVYLNLMEEDKETLKPILTNLKQLFIVSDVIITAEDLTKYNYCKVKVVKFDGERCERCWNIFDEKDLTDSLCPRCHKIVKED